MAAAVIGGLAKQTESDEHHCSIKQQQQIGFCVLFIGSSCGCGRGMKASCAPDRVVWFEHALGWAGLALRSDACTLRMGGWGDILA